MAHTILLILNCLLLLTACSGPGVLPQNPGKGLIPSQALIDMRGKKITTFIVFAAAKEFKQLIPGETLEIVTDPFAGLESDLQAWCRMAGHKFISAKNDGVFQRIYLQKSDNRPRAKRMAWIISNPGLGELLSPLGFALAAALSDYEVCLFFQGPGVRVLQKGFEEKLPGINYFFSGLARAQLSDMGHIPPQQKLQQLRELGATIYICGPSMEAFGVGKNELIFDDIIIAEYFTFMETLDRSDIQFYVQ